LVPNPTASGIYWGRQKKQVERLFFCNGIIRFDFALHIMSFPYFIFFCVSFIKIKNKKLGRIGRIFFSLGISDIACLFSRYLNSLGINLLYLDVFESF